MLLLCSWTRLEQVLSINVRIVVRSTRLSVGIVAKVLAMMGMIMMDERLYVHIVENRVYFALSAAVVAVEKQKMYMAMALMVRNNAI